MTSQLISDYDSEASLSSYISDTDDENNDIYNETVVTDVIVNTNIVLKELNKELYNKVEILKKQNIPELIQNLLYIEERIPLLNNILEDKFKNKNRVLYNSYIKKELNLKKKSSEIKFKENNMKKLLDNYKLRNEDNNDIIELNIGGIFYTTKKSTLCSSKFSYFYFLFSTEGKITKDKNGRIFIDRDGTTFKYILNWLRDKNSEHFPNKESENYELFLNDVNFYGLKDLKRIVLFNPNKYKKNDHVVYKDSENKNIVCLYDGINPDDHTYSISYWKDGRYITFECYDDEIFYYIAFNNQKIKFSSRLNTGYYYYYNSEDSELLKELELQCPICFDNIKTNELINKTPCKHIYHNKCLENWLENKNNCPKCRAKVKFKV